MTNTSSGTGLKENVASLLCYVLGWITGIVFFLLEPNNKTVRFHAKQSIIVFGTLSVIMMILGWIPILGWIILPIAWIIWVICWIVLMIKAYQGGTYHLPVAGNYADKWSA
jgi:uncharacterized membrane protein